MEFKGTKGELLDQRNELLKALESCLQGMIILSISDPNHIGLKNDIKKAQKVINKVKN